VKLQEKLQKRDGRNTGKAILTDDINVLNDVLQRIVAAGNPTVRNEAKKCFGINLFPIWCNEFHEISTPH